MNHLIEQHCKGILRSYKTFRASGDVIMHSLHDYQEWDFNETHVLCISIFRQQRRKVEVQTDKWAIVFNNKRYFIEIKQPAMRIEILSLNHTGLVIEDNMRREKTFFARLPIWEDFIRNRLPVL